LIDDMMMMMILTQVPKAEHGTAPALAKVCLNTAVLEQAVCWCCLAIPLLLLLLL
jgi:hypothetical protein